MVIYFSQVSSCQILVARWRERTPEGFWAEFSEGGKPLGYKSILSWLTAERKRNNKLLYQKARDEFGSSFDDTFSYMKNGQCFVKTKASDVAKQYLKLKGINDYDNDEGEDEGDDEDEE